MKPTARRANDNPANMSRREIKQANKDHARQIASLRKDRAERAGRES